MPFNGSGIWQRLYNFVSDRDNLIKVRADRMDGEFDNVGSAINEIVSGNRPFLAPIKVAYGTAALPGVQFEGDNNTGVYRSSADEVGVTTNGVNRLKIGNTEAEFSVAIGFPVGTLATPGLHIATDLNTGIGSTGANILNIVTGGVARQSFDITSATFTVPIHEALGSVTAPTYSFAGDTNTGIYSPSANQFAVATNGVRRLEVDLVAVTSTLPIVAPLGSAAAPAFTFAGDLNTGMYNLSNGETAFSSNGTARFVVTTNGALVNGTLNVSGATDFTGACDFGSTISVDGAISANASLSVFGNITMANGKQVFHRENIVGTVSQAGGFPTGSIIQSGSNANGTFTRFADGTMICTHSLAASAGATTVWTFPSTFIAAPEVFANANAAVPRIATTLSPTTTQCSFDIWDMASARTTNTARLQAVGRWFI